MEQKYQFKAIEQPSLGMTVARGRLAAPEVGRSGYVRMELKIKLIGLADGKNVGVEMREIQDHIQVLHSRYSWGCWRHTTWKRAGL